MSEKKRVSLVNTASTLSFRSDQGANLGGGAGGFRERGRVGRRKGRLGRKGGRVVKVDYVNKTP